MVFTHLTASELEAIAAEPYEHRGIIHSEMALIIGTVRRLGVEVVIESGRARGQSTYMLSKYLPHVLIHSVEMRNDPDARYGIARCADLPNVALHHGNGADIVPELVAANAPQRTAVLCDGPKGAAAVSILERCFDHSHVVVGFIHDMRKLDHGGPSPHRAAAVERLPYHMFSDDPRIVAGLFWMDANVVRGGQIVGPLHEAEFGSYGPTVGVFYNPHIS